MKIRNIVLSLAFLCFLNCVSEKDQSHTKVKEWFDLTDEETSVLKENKAIMKLLMENFMVDENSDITNKVNIELDSFFLKHYDEKRLIRKLKVMDK